MSVCARLGISLQPARPLTRRRIRPRSSGSSGPFQGLLVALPGYKGPDVHSRGPSPRSCAYFFIGELEQVIREWVRHLPPRPHAGLADPEVPGLELSPAGDARHGIARAGTAADPGPPGAGVRLPAGRLADDPALRRRGRRAALQRAGADPLPQPDQPVHRGARGQVAGPLGPRRRLARYFQDPADNAWHPLAWEHATRLAVPFSAEAARLRSPAGAGRRAGTSTSGGHWPSCWTVGRRAGPPPGRAAHGGPRFSAARCPAGRRRPAGQGWRRSRPCPRSRPVRRRRRPAPGPGDDGAED